MRSSAGRVRRWTVGAITAMILGGFALLSPSFTPEAEASCCPGHILIISNNGYACLYDCEHGWACCNDE